MPVQVHSYLLNAYFKTFIMKTLLSLDNIANVNAVKNYLLRTCHFVGVKSLVSLVCAVFLSVMPATAQTATTDHFVLKITTTAGTNATDKSFTFYSQDMDYMVDWGEGSGFEQVTTGDAPHTFNTAGVHTIRFRNLNDIYINHSLYPVTQRKADRGKYTSIKQWGTAVWDADMSGAFRGASNLTMTATDTPNMSAVTTMRNMFNQASSFNGDIRGWNTVSVMNMRAMFNGASSFDQDIGNWNTAKVTTMRLIFGGASSFNQNIGGWNTAKVTDMGGMFYGTTAFDQNIGGWNTAKVTDMASMFREASSFNQNIGGWNTAKVTDMSFMFREASSFNQDIGNWNTAKVTDMRYMFSGASSFNGDISRWNTASVTQTFAMFWEASSFNQDIGNWNTAKVTTMVGMFVRATSFNQNIGGWNTAKVTTMQAMFYEATAFDQDIGGWNVAKVTTMKEMFHSVSLSIANYDSLLVGWDAQNLKSQVIFHGGNSLYIRAEAQTAKANMISSDSWTITDGGLSTMNQAPTNILLSSAGITENAGANALVGMLSNTDTGGMYTYSLVGGQGDNNNGLFDVSGTSLRLTASADYEALVRRVGRRSVATYSVRINVNDGTTNFAKQFTITVADVANEHAPVFAGGATATVNYAENATTAVTTVSATDAYSGQTVRFTLSGADAGQFTLTSAGGVLTFNTPPDYENPGSATGSNVYTVTVTVADGQTLPMTATQALTITVTDESESNTNVHAPVFEGGATATVTYAENATTAVTTVVATDADTGQTVTFSLTGDDAGQFTLTPAGELTFNVAPDFEMPADMGANNVYEVTITATDGQSPPMTATQALTITVTEATAVEYFFSASQRTFTPLTDATAVTSIEDDDKLSGSLPVGFDFAFYGTTYSTLKASSNGFLTFNHAHTNSLFLNNISGTLLTHAIMPFWDDLDGDVTGAQASYKVTGSSPNRMYTFEWLNFGRVFSSGQVSLQVRLHETSNMIELVYGPGVLGLPIDASIGIKGAANDFFSLADSGVSPLRSSGGADSISTRPSNGRVYQFALTPPPPVTNVVPVITSNGGGSVATVAVAENQTAVTTVTATDANAGQTVTFTLSGGADEGLFSITPAGGELTFNTVPDFENPVDMGSDNMYEVIVTVTDNGMPAMVATQVLTITVTDVANEGGSPADHFVLKVTTTAGTNASDKSFTFYTEDTNYDIDWGDDGMFEALGVSGNQPHTFTSAGEHTIRFRNLNDVYINF